MNPLREPSSSINNYWQHPPSSEFEKPCQKDVIGIIDLLKTGRMDQIRFVLKSDFQSSPNLLKEFLKEAIRRKDPEIIKRLFEATENRKMTLALIESRVSFGSPTTLELAIATDLGLLKPLFECCYEKKVIHCLFQPTNNCSLLGRVIDSGKPEVVEALVAAIPSEYHSSLYRSAFQETPLLVQAASSSEEMMRTVIRTCPESCLHQLYCLDANGFSALSILLRNHRFDRVEALVKETPAPFLKKLYARPKSGSSVISHAFFHKDFSVALALLRLCPQELREEQFKPATGDDALLVCLLREAKGRHIADLKEYCPPDLWREQFLPDSEGNTLLHYVIYSSDYANVMNACPVDLIPTLFQRNRAGKPPIFNAILNGNGCLWGLVQACPEEYKSELFLPDDQGNTVLHVIAKTDHFPYVNVLEEVPSQLYDRMFGENNKGLNAIDEAFEFLNFLRRMRSQQEGAPIPGGERMLMALIEATPEHLIHSFVKPSDPDRLTRYLEIGSGSMPLVKAVLGLLLPNERRGALLSPNSQGLKPFESCLKPPVTINTELLAEVIPDDLPEYSQAKWMADSLINAKDDFLLRLLFCRMIERQGLAAAGRRELVQCYGILQRVKSDCRDELYNILMYDLKMNQALALDAALANEIIDGISQHFRDMNIWRFYRLALQTVTNLQDMRFCFKSVADPAVFPDRETFFSLPIEKQRLLMIQAQLLKQHKALACADRVVKLAVERQKYDCVLLLHSIRLYSRTEIQGADKLLERLSVLLSNRSYPLTARCEAASALSKIEQDRASDERKSLFASVYREIRDWESSLKLSILRALGIYDFNEENRAFADHLIEDFDQTTDEAIKREIALVLALFPYEAALRKALEIIESPLWDSIESKRAVFERVVVRGGYELFNYRPSLESRWNMKRLIGERFMLMRWNALQEGIEKIYRNYLLDKTRYPEMERVERVLTTIPDEARYLPYMIFFPAQSEVFRGLSDRKGFELLHASFQSLMMKGAGSADLTLKSHHEQGTWSTIGQTFMSAKLDYVTGSFFGHGGILMSLSAEELNRAFLRREIRFQREYSIHLVSYTRIFHQAIKGIYIPDSSMKRLHYLFNRELNPDRAERKVEKITRRRLRAKDGQDRSLFDRVYGYAHSYKVTKEFAFSEAETTAIVAVNIKRHIGRMLLARELDDPLFKECMEHTFREAFPQ